MTKSTGRRLWGSSAFMAGSAPLHGCEIPVEDQPPPLSLDAGSMDRRSRRCDATEALNHSELQAGLQWLQSLVGGHVAKVRLRSLLHLPAARFGAIKKGAAEAAPVEESRLAPTDRYGAACGRRESFRARGRDRRPRPPRAQCPCRSPRAARCRNGADRDTTGRHRGAGCALLSGS